MFSLVSQRRLMFVSPLISILSLLLLLWTFRSDRNFQSWMFYYRLPSPYRSSPDGAAETVNNSNINNGSGPTDPSDSAMAFVLVKGTKTLLVSAFVEHRDRRRHVRVLSVVLRSQSQVYRCLLCCGAELRSSVGVASIHSDHYDFAYGTADIKCPVPSGCQSPSHIAIVSTVDDAQEILTKFGGKCAGNVSEGFLEVQNREEKTDGFRWNFTVCVSTMFDFSNVLQLVQSLEMMRLLGVQRVVVYKSSCSNETQRVLDYYKQQGVVEEVRWSLSRYVNVSGGWLPLHGPGELHYHGQIPALNDCLYRSMYRSRYVALQDVDELILPQSVDSWNDLLPVLEKKYGANKCYMFENNVFPIGAALPVPGTRPPRPRPRWSGVMGVNILDHLHFEPNADETRFSNFKIIVNPRAVLAAAVHGVLESQNGCSWVERGVARMYHTREAKRPELTSDQLIYDGRLLDFSARLGPAVDHVLTASGLLPGDHAHSDDHAHSEALDHSEGHAH